MEHATLLLGIIVTIFAVVGAVEAGGSYWGYVLSVDVLIAFNNFEAAMGLLALAYLQTFGWAWWVCLALVFNSKTHKDFFKPVVWRGLPQTRWPQTQLQKQ